MIQCKNQDGDSTWERLKLQVERLAGMSFFPREKAAIRELVIALKYANSMEQAELGVNEVLSSSTSDTRCPMPYDLRLIIKAIQDRHDRQPKCSLCHGNSVISVPVLVTYKPGGYDVAKAVQLAGYSQQAIVELRGKLTEGQDIISAAVPCDCKELGRPISPGDTLCRRCHDFGYYGGRLGGQYAGEWKWCDCAAGISKRQDDPVLVDQANAIRQKLLRIPIKNPVVGQVMGQL